MLRSNISEHQVCSLKNSRNNGNSRVSYISFHAGCTIRISSSDRPNLIYKAACKMFGVNPCTSVMDSWGNSTVSLQNRALGPDAIKALTVSLLVGDYPAHFVLIPSVFVCLFVCLPISISLSFSLSFFLSVVLSFSIKYKNENFRQFLFQTNVNITRLNLRGNQMGSTGMKALSQMLYDNTFINHLVRADSYTVY